MEVWKPLKGYEKFYEVSNKGRIKSLRRNKVMKPGIGTTGYFHVNIITENTKKTMKLHRLIAKTFLDEVEGKNVINHKDGNPLNNEVENLEWCTQKENVIHAIKTGLKKTNWLNKEREIIDLYKYGFSQMEISGLYNSSCNKVKEILENNNYELRKKGSWNEKFFIDKEKMKKMFDLGERNKDIALYFGCSASLIGRYKYLYKNGEI